ncbi:unnamed protein product [Protopolystoma xenopodis]|uniref:Uncharacterized protein n=1 Tax=Protopolystoma xenopodis TaxID=117903 RepID=A0A448XAH1_9PLAT|nr:unnamed protein product [Protopolystoma xenopodis]
MGRILGHTQRLTRVRPPNRLVSAEASRHAKTSLIGYTSQSIWAAFILSSRTDLFGPATPFFGRFDGPRMMDREHVLLGHPVKGGIFVRWIRARPRQERSTRPIKKLAPPRHHNGCVIASAMASKIPSTRTTHK